MSARVQTKNARVCARVKARSARIARAHGSRAPIRGRNAPPACAHISPVCAHITCAPVRPVRCGDVPVRIPVRSLAHPCVPMFFNL